MNACVCYGANHCWLLFFPTVCTAPDALPTDAEKAEVYKACAHAVCRDCLSAYATRAHACVSQCFSGFAFDQLEQLLTITVCVCVDSNLFPFTLTDKCVAAIIW